MSPASSPPMSSGPSSNSSLIALATWDADRSCERRIRTRIVGSFSIQNLIGQVRPNDLYWVGARSRDPSSSPATVTLTRHV
jgi:hypothetical protein